MARPEKITDKLGNIDETLKKMLKVMEKTEPPIIRILIIGGLFVGISSIIGDIDTIIRWIKEGIW